MRIRFLFATTLILAPGFLTAGTATTAPAIPNEIPGRALPVVRQHTYRMAGKVRMLLLWVGRDDVGSGVIKWRGGGDEQAIELLIGSDPKRAPSQLNKWGYLVEEIRAGESTVVGLISQENDDRLSDIKADLKRRKDLRAFDTIRGHAAAVEGIARVGTLYAPSHLTYHDADAVLKDVLADSSLPVKRVPRRGNVRPGFLTSITELISTTVDIKSDTRRIQYIHGDRLFELRLLDATRLARFDRDGRTWHNVIRGRFETGEAGNRSGTRFELVYGVSGPLAGIPILISYHPKWWLQVDLVLNS